MTVQMDGAVRRIATITVRVIVFVIIVSIKEIKYIKAIYIR